MAERQKPRSERTSAERLAAIEERQSRLLTEIDRLDERIEAALSNFASERSEAD